MGGRHDKQLLYLLYPLQLYCARAFDINRSSIHTPILSFGKLGAEHKTTSEYTNPTNISTLHYIRHIGFWAKQRTLRRYQ